MIQMMPVESSNIESVGYDVVNDELHVRFLNGNVYAYLDVPFEKYEELLKEESIGRFLNKEIKPNFEFELVEEYNEDEEKDY